MKRYMLEVSVETVTAEAGMFHAGVKGEYI